MATTTTAPAAPTVAPAREPAAVVFRDRPCPFPMPPERTWSDTERELAREGRQDEIPYVRAWTDMTVRMGEICDEILAERAAAKEQEQAQKNEVAP